MLHEPTTTVPDRVRSLTVIPPWSGAIILQQVKPIENRTRNLAGKWRGRMLILSSAGKWDEDAAAFIPAITGAPAPTRDECHPGHYIGTVDLVDVHRSAEGCCAPWGEPEAWHCVLDNPVQFEVPIPATGHLGLRRVTDPALVHAADHGCLPRKRVWHPDGPGSFQRPPGVDRVTDRQGRVWVRKGPRWTVNGKHLIRWCTLIDQHGPVTADSG